MLMVANWSGNFGDLNRPAWFAVTFQSIFGLFMTIMVVARFIAFLPSPTGSSATELETEIIRDTGAQEEKSKKTKPARRRA
jgi:hypothetical protein